MANGYGTSVGVHASVPQASTLSRIGEALYGGSSGTSEGLQLSRLVTLLMISLLLTFGAVFKLADGVNSFWPEVSMAVGALACLVASYRFESVRRRLDTIVQTLGYLTSAWFITLAVANGFTANYAVGLLFIIPGLGVGFSIKLTRLFPLVVFFGVNITGAVVACYVAAGPGVTPALFSGSLICISLVTLFVAACRIDAQRKFQASEERYRAVVEQASDGIYMLDASTLSFLDANRAFCRMVGRTKAELRRLRVRDLIAAAHVDGPVERDVFDGRSCVAERMLRRADGSLMCAELHVDRIYYGSREIFSVVVHDVTARKEVERKLTKAKENAEEIARFKSSLLANMSHEIRTPLSSILGWTAILNSELPEQQRELVGLIEQSGQRLHNTLDSVLELARLHANATRLQPVLADVTGEVRRTVASLRPSAEAKGLEVYVRTHAEQVWTEIDISCLRRALHHVVDNAIKFTNAGWIDVSVEQVDGEISIRVKDTGIGIRADFLPCVFDEFKQGSVGLARDHEGNGLGLAIARRLVELLNGQIFVESRQGQGSTFTIQLPFRHAGGARALVA